MKETAPDLPTDCTHARDLLESGLPGAGEHLAVCPGCADFAAELELARAALLATRSREPSLAELDALAARVMAAVEPPARQAAPSGEIGVWGRMRRWLTTPPARLVLVGAFAALLVGAAAFLWTLTRPHPAPLQPDQSGARVVDNEPVDEPTDEGPTDELGVEDIEDDMLAGLDDELGDGLEPTTAREHDDNGDLDLVAALDEMGEDELLAFEAELDGLVP